MHASVTMAWGFNPYAVPPLVSGVAALALGVVEAQRERASRVSVSFLLLTAAIFLWLTGFALMYSVRRPAAALLWARVGYLGVPLIAPAVYDFTTQVLGLRVRRRAIVGLAWAQGLVFAVLAVSGTALVAGTYRYAWGYYPRLGRGATPFLAVFVALLALSWWEQWRAQRRAPPGRYRARLRWYLLMFGVGYVGVVDFLPALGLRVYPFGYLAVFAFTLLAGLEIRRHELVDITPSFAADEILATMRDVLIVCDRAGRIQVANHAVADVLGLRVGALVGEDVACLARGEARAAERLRDMVAGDGRTRQEEMAVPGAAAALVTLSVSAAPLHDRDGHVVGTVLMGRDISQRVRTEALLRRSAKIQALGRLAAGVAHDFNNVLHAIRADVGILRDRLPTDAGVAESLARIDRAAERGAALTGQLVNFGRPSAAPAPLDVNRVVADLREMLDRLLPHTVALSLEQGDAAPVRINRTRLEQVIMNLVVNARDAMPGGGRIAIRTAVVALAAEPDATLEYPLPSGRYTTLEVTDTGRGMDDATRRQIFEPFFTTKSGQDGTGLGLATVYGIVEHTGGGIAVETAPGRGTRFRVYLPTESAGGTDTGGEAEAEAEAEAGEP